MAEGLPGSRLTPEYRARHPYSRDWHRNTDEELDRDLDLWYSTHQAESAEPLKSLLDHPAAPTAMVNGEIVDDVATAPLLLQDSVEENQHNTLIEAKESPLSSHDSNEFDNPDFQHPPIHDDFHTLEQPHSNSPAEMKQEVAGTVMLIPSTSAEASNSHSGTNACDGSHPMQRVFTEPTVHSSTYWQSDRSEGSPFSNTVPYSGHGMHQAASTTPERIWQQPNNPILRARSQTFHLDPHQPTYGSVQYGGVGQRQYTPIMSSHRMTQPFHGVSGHYDAGIHASTYDQVSGSSPMGGITNNSHFINRQNTQHNNNVGSPSVNAFQFHNDPASTPYRRVSSQDILKSQPLPASSADSRVNAHSVSLKPGEAVRRRSQLDMVKEETELQACADLIYKNVEAARQAERPKFKICGKKDITIPETDIDKQKYVVRMLRSMNHSGRAQDNPGMVNQWEKLKQDGPRVEQAAWRLLVSNFTLYTAVEKIKQIFQDMRVTNNRKVNSAKKNYYDKGRRAVYSKMTPVGRRGSSASTQMRLDDSDYGDTTFGDPHLGGNPGAYGELGDEDAEGEIDEDYVDTTAATRASAAIRRPKRERETEDHEYGAREKKSRRTPAKDPSDEYPTATKRHIKNPRKKTPGWNSKLQVIDEIMIDLNDKTHEGLVYARGAPRVRELFDKIHYPDGRPASCNGGYNQCGQVSSASSSRRVSRAAAPVSFAGQDNSDETDGSYTDEKIGEADDFYQS
ncbi:MAG: hypothetical protein Q9224_000537 [Gallowayella concinna]